MRRTFQVSKCKAVLHLFKNFHVLLSLAMTVFFGLIIYDTWNLSQLSIEETNEFQGRVDSVSREFEYHRQRQFPFDLIESRKIVIILKGISSQFIVSNAFEESHFPLMESLTDSSLVIIRTYQEIVDYDIENVFSIESSKGILFDPLLVKKYYRTRFDNTWWVPILFLLFTGFLVRTQYHKLMNNDYKTKFNRNK